MNMIQIGWSPFFQEQLCSFDPSLVPARVVCEEKSSYSLLAEEGELHAEVTGRFRLNATSSESMPKTGDWVMIQVLDGSRKGLIHHLLDRKTVFRRKEPGSTTCGQILAANFDTVFIVNGFDRDFNPRRIERYLTLVRETGGRVVIVLNKMDLCPDPDDAIRSLAGIAFDVPVIPVSALYRKNLTALNDYLGLGQTAALIGSSGCGKSMLINALLEDDRQVTGSLRQSDQRGRHTTTKRELIRIPERGWIIDNPGLREVQLWTDLTGLSSAFPEIDRLGLDCHFSDCTHLHEPECAVRKAVESGELGYDRFRNYLQMKKELVYLEHRQKDKVRQTEKRNNYIKKQAPLLEEWDC